MCDPRSEEGANESEGNGHEQSATAAAAKRFADGAADRGDHDENNESRECECHDVPFTLILDAFLKTGCSVVHRELADAVRPLACGFFTKSCGR
jgi:hypothetical protein